MQKTGFFQKKRFFSKHLVLKILGEKNPWQGLLNKVTGLQSITPLKTEIILRKTFKIFAIDFPENIS